jgi:hypothetical protein
MRIPKDGDSKGETPEVDPTSLFQSAPSPGPRFRGTANLDSEGQAQSTEIPGARQVGWPGV